MGWPLDWTKAGQPPKAANPGNGYVSVKWSCLRSSALPRKPFQVTLNGEAEREPVINVESQGGERRKKGERKEKGEDPGTQDIQGQQD